MSVLTDKLVWEYVEGFFQKSGKTHFPTVRDCARKFRVRQQEIVDTVEGAAFGVLIITSYPGTNVLGDYFVETLDAEFPRGTGDD